MAHDADRLSSLFSLDGKLAVVTGGSRGIGYMIADGLIDAGCRLIISARKVEQVTAAAAALSEKGECRGDTGRSVDGRGMLGICSSSRRAHRFSSHPREQRRSQLG